MASNIALQGSGSKNKNSLKSDSNGEDLGSGSPPGQPGVIDIRDPNHTVTLKEDVLRGLKNKGLKSLPTMLFYNADGLQLFEQITGLEEYYLTQNEMDVFHEHAKLIVSQFPVGVQLLELGSGGLSKIQILLDEFEKQKKDCHYYALDLDESELERSFDNINIRQYSYVRFDCLQGTYTDGLKWLNHPENREGPMCIMSIGSSLGNFDYKEACNFLRTCACHLYPGDKMMIGLDSCNNEKRVYRAYNDSAGLTEKFYYNALTHANTILGSEVFKRENWELSTLYDAAKVRHEAYLIAKVDFQYEDISIQKGEKVLIEQSQKYPNFSFMKLWADCGLVPKAQFANYEEDYFIHILEQARTEFAKIPEVYMAYPLPTVEDFEDLWHVWDLVTLGIVPVEALKTRPVGLIHDLIFYLGHTPTFSDIQIARATRQEATKPEYFWRMFARGIDPDVNNPTSRHSINEIPDEWPPLQEILQYRNKVRARIRSLLGSGGNVRDPYISRALWIGFEHEAMHLETFIYMLIQSDNIRPTKTLPMPDFMKMARAAARTSRPAQWVSIPSQVVEIGMDGPPPGKVPQVTYCWDNEMPKRLITTTSFFAHNRPITNRDYAFQLEKNPELGAPASWVHDPRDQNFVKDCRFYNIDQKLDAENKQPSVGFVSKWKIKTINGKVPLMFALDWPAMASYVQFEAYAKIEGCRIPTHEEAKAIYQVAANQGISKRRKSNSGSPTPALSTLPHLVDLSSANVGFDYWHPLAVTHDEHIHGHADFGGVWEWTSTVLKKHAGFRPMPEYPDYTMSIGGNVTTLSHGPELVSFEMCEYDLPFHRMNML
ncbi:hypothetical protein KEM54_005432 [Ascosphaera aggregata]|nr:hypothetical protein KEM54_005432 [Ascosphaera aggregata]